MKFKTYTMEDALEAIIDYRGKTPKKSDSGIPTLSAKSVKNNHIDYSLCYYISPDEYKHFMVRGFPKIGDVLLTTEAPMGVVARLDRDDVAIAQRLLTLRGKENVLDNEYLLYFLQSSSGQSLLKARETGTTVTGIKQAEFRKIQINVPEISIQKKIGRFLRALDEKIEINSKINKNLEQQAEAIFQSILSNAITTVNLGEIADVKGGKRLPKGVNLIDIPNAHPYIRVRDLNNALFASLTPNYAYVDKETQKSISRYIVSTGDVLISIVGTIGLTAIVDSTLDKANLTENCVKVTNLKHITPEYLLLYLRSQLGREAIAKGTVGAVQQKLPIKNIQAIPIPLLSEKDKNALFCTLDSIFAGISNNVIQSAKLASLRDTLLPRLMSGELDVSDIDL